jgi:gas vesicle protein
MSSDNLGSNLVYFLLGAAAGAAIALLYAPQEGEATRRFLGEKANEYKDKATEVTSNVAQKASELTSNVAQTAKEKVGMISDKAQEIMNRGQSAVHDGIDKAADKAHTAVNSVPS